MGIVKQIFVNKELYPLILTILSGIWLIPYNIHAQTEVTTCTIQGVIIDEYGTTIPKATIFLHSLQSVNSAIDTTVSDNSGQFLFQVQSGSYRLVSTIRVNNVFAQPRLWKAFQVDPGETAHVTLDTRKGCFLELTDIQINGIVPPVEVIPGESLTVEFTFRTWSPLSVPYSDQHIILGFGSVGQVAYIIGKPGIYPGFSDRVKLNMQVPETGESITAYAHLALYSKTAQDSLIDVYNKAAVDTELNFIPLGRLIVKP